MNKGKRICLSALYHHKEWLDDVATEFCFFQHFLMPFRVMPYGIGKKIEQ
jgi:hypothetical protein